LLAVLRDIGFTCERSEPFRSRIDDIDLLELPNRTEDAVIIEGEKG